MLFIQYPCYKEWLKQTCSLVIFIDHLQDIRILNELVWLLFKVSDITSQIAVILDNFKAEVSKKMFSTGLFSMVYFE